MYNVFVISSLYEDDKEPLYHVVSHRQCALVALQDVKAYLMKEGGQIAVSRLSCHFDHLWCLVSKSFQMFFL